MALMKVETKGHCSYI